MSAQFLKSMCKTGSPSAFHEAHSSSASVAKVSQKCEYMFTPNTCKQALKVPLSKTHILYLFSSRHCRQCFLLAEPSIHSSSLSCSLPLCSKNFQLLESAALLLERPYLQLSEPPIRALSMPLPTPSRRARHEGKTSFWEDVDECVLEVWETHRLAVVSRSNA